VEKCEIDRVDALYVPERIVGDGFWIKVRDFERSFYTGTVVDAVRFIRKDLFERVEGFDESLIGPEDWDFDRRIRRIGRTGIINTVLYHNEGLFNMERYLKKKNYYLLAISHSPQKIVKEFAKKLGFDKVYGRIFELDKQRKFTGKMLYSELIFSKAKILKRAVEKEKLTLKGSVGVGDTEGDIPFLKMVDNPICFNPNLKLYRYAKRLGWKIVIERKDVICCL